MAILSKGTDFTTGDQVTAAKLDELVDNATFASGAVDNSTTQLDGSGRIIVKDGGITAAKLNLNDGVTINDNTMFITCNNNSQDVGFIGTDSGTGNFSINAGGSTDELSLKTDGNSRLTIKSDGKVGIGATSPAQELEVVGDITANSIIAREAATDNCLRLLSDPEAPDGTNGGSMIELFAQDAGNASQTFHKASFHTFQTTGSSATDVFIINSAASTSHFVGKLGIGQSTPSTALDIQNTSEDQITLTNTSGNFSKIRSKRGLVLAADYDADSGATQSYMAFETDNAERMRITPDGHIIISNMPTSASGLASGTIYSDSGTLKIVS